VRRLAYCVAVLALAARADAQPAAPVLQPPRPLTEPRIELPTYVESPPAGSAVDLLLDIDAEGAVVAVTVGTSLREDIDLLAMDAARLLRFEPARQGGEAIPSRVRLRLEVTSAAPVPTPVPVSVPVPDQATTSPASPTPPVPDDGEPPYETVVRGAIVPPEPGASSRVVLTGAELTTVPGTFGEPLRVVATLPGVVRSPFGLGYFLVRGASFENTGFLVDGFPVPILYHFFAGPAVISSRLVEHLDFYPGGYPVAYGRFSAGLISLRTAPPPTRQLHLEAEVDLFRAGALAVVPVGERTTVAVAARRSYYDVLLPLVIDDVDVAYADYQIRADHELTRRLRASAFVFASEDTLDVSQATGTGTTVSTETTSIGYAFVRGIGTLAWDLGDDATLVASGMLGRDWTSFRDREPGQADFGAEITGTYVGGRAELRIPAERDLALAIGVDVASTSYDLDSSFPSPLGLGEFPRPGFDPQPIDIHSSVRQLAGAVYVEPTLRAGPVELVPGLRLDLLKYGEVSSVFPDPRGVVRVTATDDVLFKASTGLFTQPPNPLQLDESLGSPDLQPQRSWQSSTGAEILLPDSIELQPTVFYSRMFQLPRFSGDFEVRGGEVVAREIFVADGEGRAYGFEMLLRRKVEAGLYGWISYTLARSERFLEGGQAQPFAFDQTHTLNVAASYLWGRWRFGGRFTLASGRPTPRIVGAVFDADADRYDPERTGLNFRLPTYHQLDVRIDREFDLGPIRCSAFLDVINVYYAKNAEGRLYQYDYRRSTPLPGVPILPTIGIKGELR